MELKDKTVSAKILNPFDNQIVSKNVDEETIEEELTLQTQDLQTSNSN